MSEVAKSCRFRDETGCVRMSFNLSVEVYEELAATFDWGQRGKFISAVVTLAMNKLRQASFEKTKGYAVIGAIMAGDYDPLLSTEVHTHEEAAKTT